MIGTHASGFFPPQPSFNTPPIYDPREASMAPAAAPAAPWMGAPQPPVAAPAPAAPWAMPQQPAPMQQAPQPQPAAAEPQGIWGRIGHTLQQPGMSAAFLRAAGAAFDGEGLGGMIGAGVQSMDHTHAQQQATAQQQFENQMLQFKTALAAKQAQDTANKVSYTPVPAGGTLIGHYGNGNLVDPSQAASPGNLSVPRVSSAQDYAQIPAGAEYMTPSGERRRKGGAPSAGGATFP